MRRGGMVKISCITHLNHHASWHHHPKRLPACLACHALPFYCPLPFICAAFAVPFTPHTCTLPVHACTSCFVLLHCSLHTAHTTHMEMIIRKSPLGRKGWKNSCLFFSVSFCFSCLFLVFERGGEILRHCHGGQIRKRKRGGGNNKILLSQSDQAVSLSPYIPVLPLPTH